MKSWNGWQAPRLSFLALGLIPNDRLPIGRENEVRRGWQFQNDCRRVHNVQEERLIDGVFMRAGFDEHAMLQTNIRSAQIFGDRNIVRLLRER